MKKIAILLFGLTFFLTGCYHARITTGLEASDEVYEQKWAAGFIAGLVPPDLVRAEQHCTNGVAVVETRLSFMNQFVTFLSMGIYSPMEIRVTCAAATAENVSAKNSIELAKNSSDEVVRKAFGKAAELSAKSETPVYVNFK